MSYLRIVPDRDRPDGWKILELGGIPVYVEPSFFLFMGLIALMQMGPEGINIPAVGIIIVALCLSLLVHEFGHAITAKLCGCGRIFIALRLFGGYATHTPTTRGKSLLIIIMGPAFGFALYLLATLLWNVFPSPPASIRLLLLYLMWMNLFWTLFNLLPIYPLDGGQALFNALAFWKYNDDAMLLTAKVSMATAVVTGIWAYSHHEMFIGIYCLSFFMSNLQIVQAYGGGSRWR